MPEDEENKQPICPFCQRPVLGAKDSDPLLIHTIHLSDGQPSHRFCHDQHARETGIVEP
jgi:hypothetical protein